MKKMISLVLAAAICLSLASCSTSNPSASQTPNSSAPVNANLPPKCRGSKHNCQKNNDFFVIHLLLPFSIHFLLLGFLLELKVSIKTFNTDS